MTDFPTFPPIEDDEYTDESYAAEQIGSAMLDGLMREADEGAYLPGTVSPPTQNSERT